MSALRTAALVLSLLAFPAHALGAPGLKPTSAREELSARPPAPGERTLSGRIIAPCCWQQTLDVHESDLTRDLRLEIRARLYAGETPEAIEESFVARYGERVRAAAPRDPMKNVAGGLFLAAALAGLGVLGALRRFRHRAPQAAPTAPTQGARDAYDERLDSELRALE